MKYLKKNDPAIYKLIKLEGKRQAETLMMIPSENMVSQAVQEAVGSVLGNKYAEGYPFRRYYQGQQYIDQIESLVIERVKKAFGVPFANVQPLSGAPANMAVYFALLNPGDKVMGLALAHGGHLTHGAPVNASAKYYKAINYTLGKDGMMDYELIEKLALKEKPQIIVAGITAYPKQLNWKKFRQISDKVGAWLMADIAHLAGLVLGGVYPSPAPWVDIITTTTHKTLRGPRGAIIMATDRGLKKDPDLGKKINRAVFPGLQGGPHENAIAGIGIALKETQSQRFKKYSAQIVKNCEVLAQELKKYGFNLVAGGSNTHVILMDLRKQEVGGKLVAEALEAAGIVLNYNAVPWDTNPPFYPSGIRLGTPGITSRGMKEKEMVKIAGWMNEVIEKVAQIRKNMKTTLDQERKRSMRETIIKNIKVIQEIKEQVKKLCLKFPIKEEY